MAAVANCHLVCREVGCLTWDTSDRRLAYRLYHVFLPQFLPVSRARVLLVVRDMKVDRFSLSTDRRLGLGGFRGVVGNVQFSIRNGSIKERQEVGWLVPSANQSTISYERLKK